MYLYMCFQFITYSRITTSIISMVHMYIYTYLHFTTLSRITMGWLRLVGSFKLQVSFAEYSLFYRAFLQKWPIILRSLLIVATPQQVHHSVCKIYICVRYLYQFAYFILSRIYSLNTVLFANTILSITLSIPWILPTSNHYFIHSLVYAHSKNLHTAEEGDCG